jgi:hypothetical protein
MRRLTADGTVIGGGAGGDQGERSLARGIRLAALFLVALLALALPADARELRRAGFEVPEAPPHCTTHFCVHFVTKGPDAPSLEDEGGAAGVPDYVEKVARAAERARSVQNGRLRWRKPVSDGRRGGGSGLTDIYIHDLSDFANGYTSTDRGQKGLRRSAYIALHNRLSVDRHNLESVWFVVAHEYNHVLQDAYDARIGGWMAESTASWIADQLFRRRFPSLTSMQAWVRQTEEPITEGDPQRQYGTAAWNHWLASRYGRKLVRRSWASLAKVKPRHLEPAAYDRAISRSRGPGFSREFARFAAASAEWRARSFSASWLYPDVARRGKLIPGRARARRLDHTAYVLLDVPRSPEGKLVLSAAVKRGTRSAVALVGRRGPRDEGEVSRRLEYLRHGGKARVTLGRPERFDRITAVLVNADWSERGPDRSGGWRWTRDDRLFRVRVGAG